MIDGVRWPYALMAVGVYAVMVLVAFGVDPVLPLTVAIVVMPTSFFAVRTWAPKGPYE